MLGAVIVNYKTPDLVIKCVSSLLEHGIVEAGHIVVVENGSGDNSLDALKATLPFGVKLVDAQLNGGFGAGVNLGVKELETEFVLVLNPDTYFVDKSINSVLERLKSDPTIGLAGLDLVYPGGERQYSARRFYSLLDIFARRTKLGRSQLMQRRTKRHLMQDEIDKGLAFDADWVMGTGFLIRKSVFDALGGMDESYFLYMEDVDLCARTWEYGYRVVAFPGATLVHDHQRASSAGMLSWAGKQHLRSLFIFYKKYKVPMFFSPAARKIAR
jgi:N-acetylglucosaminyl-diphospho-decaprenol L-rhamnosyltransferase